MLCHSREFNMEMIYFFDIFGTFAFAVSGAIAGVRKKMDIYGIIFLAIVTAVGGGTLRDVLLGQVPPFIFRDYNYLYVSIFAAVFVFFFHPLVEARFNLLLIMDAIGLGVFTVIGVSIGLDAEIGALGALLMGVMTGTAGGMLRDVLQKEIPLVLQREIYASSCLAGGFLFLLFEFLDFSRDMSIIVSALLVFVVRYLSIRHRWSLPRPK